MKKILIPAALAALSAASTQAALVATQQATITSAGFVNSSASTGGSVGRNTANTVNFRAFGLFNVDALLTSESLTFADLATTEFAFSFTTEGGTTLSTLSAETYKVGFIGFYQNLTFNQS